MADDNRPLPVMTELSKIFYDGCKDGKLLYQQCRDCSEVIFFPKTLCSNCMGRNLAWRESSGKGEIYTFTVTYNSAPPEFMPFVPFALAVINIAEGFSILSNIEECNFEKIQCGMPVVVKFIPITSDVTLPKFIPADEKLRSKTDPSKKKTI